MDQLQLSDFLGTYEDIVTVINPSKEKHMFFRGSVATLVISFKSYSSSDRMLILSLLL